MATTSTSAPSKSTGGAATVGKRYEFYRDGFRALAGSLPVLAIALLVSVGFNVALATRKAPDPRYFAVDPAGRMTQVHALSEPYVTDAYLTQWVADKVTRSYARDPKNYRMQMGDMKPAFTDDGYASWVSSVESSGELKLMLDNLLVVSAIPTATPVVTEHGLVGGVYFWKVQIPMLVDFTSASKSAKQRRVITVTVVRRQTLESSDGIGISQFISQDS